MSFDGNARKWVLPVLCKLIGFLWTARQNHQQGQYDIPETIMRAQNKAVAVMTEWKGEAKEQFKKQVGGDLVLI